MKDYKKGEVVHLFDDDIDHFYDGWDTLAVVILFEKNKLHIKAVENNQVIKFLNGEANGMTISENIKKPTKSMLKEYSKGIKKSLTKVDSQILNLKKRKIEIKNYLDQINGQIK